MVNNGRISKFYVSEVVRTRLYDILNNSEKVVYDLVQKHLDEINKWIMSKEIGSYRAVAKVRKSFDKMTLSMI